jgi:hypothetical protein
MYAQPGNRGGGGAIPIVVVEEEEEFTAVAPFCALAAV